MDFGGLLSLLTVFCGEGSSDDVLLDDGNTVLLLVSVQASKSGESLGSESSGHLDIGQTFKILVTLLDDGEGQNSDVLSNDAPSDRLLLLLSGSSGSVALLSLSHEDSHSALEEDSLSHGETLFIVSSGDLNLVSLELITELVGLDNGTHSSVEENGAFFVVINFVGFLCTC